MIGRTGGGRPGSLLTLVCFLLACSLASAGGVTGQASPAADPGPVVRPGDRVAFRIWEDVVLQDTVHVDERGRVVLPMLGEVEVAGLTPSLLRSELLRRYQEYVRNSPIEVTLLRRVGIRGEVRRPSVYWLDPTMTLPEAISVAGGLTDLASRDDIRLLREGRRIDVGQAEADGSYEPLLLHSGDQIVVARKSWFALNAPFLISAGLSAVSLLSALLF